jgi:predicted RNase H-like nuclease
MIVAGVDGCRAGWVAIVWGQSLSIHVLPEFVDVLALETDVIAIDMPIGFARDGRRAAESAARSVLGGRQSSLFAMPARAAIYAEDYRAACALNQAHTNPPKKISKQSFFLFPKIRQIDAVITPALQARVHECHPEVAFWAMNGCQPLELPKKVKSRVHEPGLALRRALLTKAGFPIDSLPAHSYPASKLGADDVLDACACAWSARRIAQGTAIRFPQDVERDEQGLDMAIKG